MNNSTSRFSGSVIVLDRINEDNNTLEFSNIYITKVLYNNPATIVFWSDGTKTVSKCSGNDIYSKETGLAICLAKRLIGSSHVRELFSDWLEEESPDKDYAIYLKDVRKKHNFE